MALCSPIRLVATLMLLIVLICAGKQSFAQTSTGNLLIYTVDKKGKPYCEYIVKLKMFDSATQAYLTYERYETYVYNPSGKITFEGLPQGKYQIYVQCSRTQIQTTKEITFNPSPRLSQVAITLYQEQYWK